MSETITSFTGEYRGDCTLRVDWRFKMGLFEKRVELHNHDLMPITIKSIERGYRNKARGYYWFRVGELNVEECAVCGHKENQTAIKWGKWIQQDTYYSPMGPM